MRNHLASAFNKYLLFVLYLFLSKLYTTVNYTREGNRDSFDNEDKMKVILLVKADKYYYPFSYLLSIKVGYGFV